MRSRVFRSFFRRFVFLIFCDGFGKLIGAGSIPPATNPSKQRFDFVDVFVFNKARNALQVAAATADKTDVVHFVVCVNVKQNLSGASAHGGISEHNVEPHCKYFTALNFRLPFRRENANV